MSRPGHFRSSDRSGNRRAKERSQSTAAIRRRLLKRDHSSKQSPDILGVEIRHRPYARSSFSRAEAADPHRSFRAMAPLGQPGAQTCVSARPVSWLPANSRSCASRFNPALIPSVARAMVRLTGGMDRHGRWPACRHRQATPPARPLAHVPWPPAACACTPRSSRRHR